ncbi:hypothetical protein PYW08_000626 [Mythimna loreyi]|uniref:Uncharacterized protein n=1 Tax=Mythimna loreyi TaxID=667449 RepID=A0ACC2RCX5_9NEOP|nr:hypothetical protein PYW08_000626 [Mythimna loreyi]
MAENQSKEKEKQTWRNETMPEPFCRCWNGDSETEPGDPDCGCGEELDIVKWRWEAPRRGPKWVDLYQDKKQVVFHPFYSSGTAVAKGNIALKHNVHYYWEIKMLTQPYGTDIMVGVGTSDVADAVRDYTTCLGGTENSYGLSYTGAICQNGVVVDDCPGFCKGTVIGIMVDMFHGTLEFYLNRVPQGILFIDLRRHKRLHPMVCSTAAQSSMRLTYASSWTNSLLINAAKVLAASVTGQRFFKNMPPGLARALKLDFWIPLPSAGKVLQDDSERYIRKRVKERRF